MIESKPSKAGFFGGAIMVTLSGDGIESLSGKKRVIELQGERPLPPFPTAYLPGSPEKIEVMRNRAKAGCQLHHPKDAKFTDDERFRLRQFIRDLDNNPIFFDELPDERSMIDKLRDEIEGVRPWDIDSED